MFEEPVGPVVVAQLDTPETPVTAQEPTAVGDEAPFGPLTVAVKVTVDPSVAVDAFAVTATAGVVLLTVVVPPEVRAEAQ